MAASHRSPSMRDQRRAHDEYQDDIQDRERGRRDRRQRSTAASDHRREADSGLRIKGIADSTSKSQPSSKIALRRGADRPRVDPRVNQSSFRPERTEGPAERPRKPSVERPLERHRHRDKDESVTKRRRSRSRSPLDSIGYRDERRRTRSPVFSSRTDRGVSNRRSGRPLSPPPRSPRVDHYSSARDDTSASRTAFDSYVPSNRRRRSRTPIRDEYRPAPVRRRSPSPVRQRNPRDYSPAASRQYSPPRPSRRGYGLDLTQRPPRSRQPSQSRPEAPSLKRKSDPLPSQEEERRGSKRYKRSPSPYERDIFSTERRKMQSSGRPFQPISHNESRPHSPPRRIPSFEAQYPSTTAGPGSYPTHETSRRPPHIDTRHGYTPSPQWTPVASHQGSPHSASPYGHGRGGWGGQTPQYQGQSR